MRHSLVILAVLFCVTPVAHAKSELDKDWIGFRQLGECGGDSLVIVANGLSVILFSGTSGDAEITISSASFRSNAVVLKGSAGMSVLPAAGLQKCAGLPSRLQILFGEATAVFVEVAGVITACSDPNTRACFEAAFALGDVTRDGKLSRAEISRLARAAAFFVGYEAILSAGSVDKQSNKKTRAKSAELQAAMLASNLISPVVATNLLASYDFDDDGTLTLDELLQDRQGVNPEDLVVLLGRDSVTSVITEVLKFGTQAAFGLFR